ncbi:MAG: type 1 glutamine amidotransferase [Chitinispirillaceae bacterium]|nr:type 1 glutamine amidotransferase [Chitinispirillaceae bacterium]
MKVHYLQHESYEDPGLILDWAAARRHTLTSTMVYRNEPLPSFDSFDLLVIMGGSMSACDDAAYPWLSPEKAFIRTAMDSGRAVLGICLGAQMIAAALGAAVYANKNKEIGWFPVTLTPQGTASRLFKGWPLTFPCFHWHEDTFDLPNGATRIAFSKACMNQAFICGRRTVALQFHIECTRDSITRMITKNAKQIVPGGLYVQPAEEMLKRQSETVSMRRQLFTLLDTMSFPTLS